MTGLALRTRSSDYLARTSEGDWVVLLSAPDSTNVLEVRYGAFSISAVGMYEIDVDRTPIRGTFVAVRLFADSVRQLDAFLQLIGFLLENSPTPVQESSLASVLRDFERLFARRRVVSRQTVQGLWGELWTIRHSGQMSELVKNWHVTARDALDFATPTATVEVKTHEGDRPVHHFAHRQLLGDQRENWVVSILVGSDAGGQTVLDLLEDIAAPLGVAESHHFRGLVLESLDGDLETASEMRWIFRGAKDRCAILVGQIPHVHVPEGAGISDVHYAVDLGAYLADHGTSLIAATQALSGPELG